MTNPIPSYIQIPPSGQVINEPTDFSSPIQAQALPRPSVSARPSFPPAASDTQAPPSRKFNVPTSALSTNVSDLLLSSLLPPNLPKLPASTGRGEGSGRVRELSTQREALSLPLVSNNFRRFVTKVRVISGYLPARGALLQGDRMLMIRSDLCSGYRTV
jgi:hypothetical protein